MSNGLSEHLSVSNCLVSNCHVSNCLSERLSSEQMSEIQIEYFMYVDQINGAASRRDELETNSVTS